MYAIFNYQNCNLEYYAYQNIGDYSDPSDDLRTDINVAKICGHFLRLAFIFNEELAFGRFILTLLRNVL